jgi:hypothetical protein
MAIIRLVRGKDTLDLTQTPFALGSDFVPPSARWTPNITSGTGINTYGGGVKVSESAANRELSFSVLVKAASAAAVTAGVRRLQTFLADDEGLWFEYSPFDLPAPCWGQLGAPLRYEVVHAQAPTLSDEYGRRTLREQIARVSIHLTVKPLALGARQQLAQAAGAVWEETVGMDENQVRGLRIASGGSNKMTNPVFAHDTYNTGWAAGTDLVVSRNSDPRHCFPGSPASPYIVARAGASRTYRQTINVGNTNPHFFTAYVARADGVAVTAADCHIYYGADLTTEYGAMGNGIYRLSANASGINAATLTGLTVEAGHGVYLLAFGCDVSVRPAAIHHGDMLGGAWAGTEHESVTTRTAGQVKTPLTAENFNLAAGAVHLLWKPDNDSTVGADRYLFACGAASLRAYYNATDDKIYFTDNTNTASSAAQSFAAGDILDLHFVWGTGGLAVYKNGVSIASVASYTPPALPSELYWLTDSAGANNADGLLLGAEIYDNDLTAAQAQAIYTASAALTAGGARASSIPLLWTKDGDNVLDNCDDATRDNWGVVLGVPGDAAALLQTKLDNTGGFDEIWISSISAPAHIPARYFWAEKSGTADAGASGGAVVSGTGTSAQFDFAHYTPYIADRAVMGFLRVQDAVASDRVTITGGSGNGQITVGFTGPCLARSEAVGYPRYKNGAVFGVTDTPELTVQAYFAGTALIDWVMLLPSPLLRIEDLYEVSISYGKDAFLDGDAVLVLDEANYYQQVGWFGEMVQIEPNAYNRLGALMTRTSMSYDYEGPVPSLTVTLSPAFITPRWSLL